MFAVVQELKRKAGSKKSGSFHVRETVFDFDWAKAKA
jgi:hypothetical protein